MTRKDYQLIATALREARPEDYHKPEHHNQWRLDVVSIARALAGADSTFKRDVFKAACGFHLSEDK